MCKIPGGYILFARQTLDSDIMEWPGHYLKLWVWMLGKAFWKDGEKLKKGQFVTTIAEMQKVGGYKIGYRTRDLTKDEVRSAYEAFTKATMITTTKTTRGMIITICNYDKYQNPKNYEAHNEPHNEDTTNPTGTPHDREEGYKKDNIKPTTTTARARQRQEEIFRDCFKQREVDIRRLYPHADYEPEKETCIAHYRDGPSIGSDPYPTILKWFNRIPKPGGGNGAGNNRSAEKAGTKTKRGFYEANGPDADWLGTGAGDG